MLVSLLEIHETAKVWVYQSNRNLTVEEVVKIDAIIENFVINWQSHQIPVKGYGKTYYNRFIVFFADETSTLVSGCSIDSSVKVVKQIESEFKITCFDRMQICIENENIIESIHFTTIKDAIKSGKINQNSFIFNNLVANKKEWEQNWRQPVLQSKYF